MRYVRRLNLDGEVQADLESRQADADRQRREGELDVAANWQTARQTRSLKLVLATLQQMMGKRQRACIASTRTAPISITSGPRSRFQTACLYG